MKLSIQTLGSLGDVMPYIALALRLQAHGAEVSILAPRDYTPHIKAYGLNAAPAPDFRVDDWLNESEARGTLANPLAFFRDWDAMIAPHIEDVTQKALNASEGADAIIANLICAPARLAAEAKGIPFILTAQQPVLTPTCEAPCAMVWRPGLPRALNPASYGAVHVAQRFMERALRSQRKSLGIAQHTPMYDMRAHLGRSLPRITSVAPMILDQRPKDWGATDFLTAYPSLPASPSQTLPPAIEAFLNAGAPPVYIGLGSLDAAEAKWNGSNLLDGLARSGLRAIFSRGFAAGLNADLSAHCIADALPHDVLFPRCVAALHHGGAGTLDTALRAGCPQIIMPHHLDQFWYATRLHALGLAPGHLKRSSGAGNFAEAFRFATSDETQARARTIAVRVRPIDGAGDLAQLILNLLKARAP